MDYLQAVDYLNRHIGLGGESGLHRIEELLALMGDPQTGYPLLHIAGTNGKTSTARMATLVLVAHDLTTGTYTSPHLEAVEERLGVNGRAATAEEFALAMSDVAAFADIRERAGAEPNSYFELATAAAFAFFADQAVNAAVLEVGLGGRLDATNVVDAEVCVVTSIGIDHTEFLGADIKSIAGEKLAIAGPSSILVTGPLPDLAQEAAVQLARDLGIQHRSFGDDFGIVSAERGVGGWMVEVRGAERTYEEVFLPVHGRHQVTNLAVAIAGSEALVGRKLDPEAVADAAAVVSLPGRMEPLQSGPLVLLDGAHNADGIEVLVESLQEEYPSTKWQVVVGLMGDKNVDLMTDRLAPVAAGFIATAVDSPRAMPADHLAERIARRELGVPVLASDDPGHAVDMARAEAGPDGAVLVTGSLYLVGAVRSLAGTG